MKLYHNCYIWQDGKFSHHLMKVLVNNGLIELIIPNDMDTPIASVSSIDLKGSFVYPGFIDTHTHCFEGGLYSLGVKLDDVVDMADLFARLSEACRSKSPKYPIFAWRFDESSIPERRFPFVSELDRICSDKPIILRRIDGHSCILNTFARKLIANDLSTESEILRGKNNDVAVHYFHSRLDEEVILQAYSEAAQYALRNGFTGAHTMIGDADQSIGHYQLIRENLSTFAIDYTIYPQSFNIKAALDVGAKRIGGCILADGSIGSNTAALFDPYKNSVSRGILYQSDEFWKSFIQEAHKNKMQVAVHCIGDRAIKQINDVYKQITASDAHDLRHQLIHCELTNNELIDDIKLSGAVPVMQPNFDHYWGGKGNLYERMLGVERAKHMNRFGSLNSKGIRITGGSDWYITPMDVVQSIRAAMNHHNPEERLSHAEAVDIYTRNAAWLSGEELSRGEITPGYRADFSIMSHALDDSHATPATKYIVRGGEIVYES